jgi:cytochrome b6
MAEYPANGKNIVSWFEHRLAVSSIREFLAKKTVPIHRHSFLYIFGGLAVFFFLVQLATGVLLSVYYSPTPETAHESVQRIISEVPFGWLVRSIHIWSSNLMIAVVLIHLMSTFFMRAYRKPRELMWISGSLLLILVLGLGFTGYLLPWDTTAYFATQIGTEIPRSTPVVGDLVVRLLRGGDYIDAESMKRFFALHVIILPLFVSSVMLFHLIYNQVYGTSTPISVRQNGPTLRFYPNYVYRDLLAWTAALTVLMLVATLFPVQLGNKANPFEAAPIGIKPEWYFLPLFQTLRMVPATVAGVGGETIVNMMVGIVLGALFALPFLDRKSSRGEANIVPTLVGIVAFTYFAVAVTLAYLT